MGFISSSSRVFLSSSVVLHLYMCTFNSTESSEFISVQGRNFSRGWAGEELRITIWHLAFRHKSSAI